MLRVAKEVVIDLNANGQRAVLVKGVDDRVDVIGYCAVGSNLGYNTVRGESALPLLNMLNHNNSNRLEQLNRYINMKLYVSIIRTTAW